MSWQAALGLQAALTLVAAAGVYWLLRRQHRSFGSHEEHATLRSVAFATSTMRELRRGLSSQSAARVLPEVQSQAGAPAVALFSREGLLAFFAAGPGEGHRRHVGGDAAPILDALMSDRPRLLTVHPQTTEGCALRAAVVAPLVVNREPVAALVTYHTQPPSPAGLRIACDLSELLATQLRLQEVETQRVALARSELKALRAQISPHFIYNTLTTIAAFIRTDPDRARQLITEFADFTRRAFSSPQEFSTLADELVYVNQYLVIEQARLGERLHVRYHIEPEVLSITVPALILQPLVENSIKHGIEGDRGSGSIDIRAEDQDDECLISVSDDGGGFQPEPLKGEQAGALANIDRRLRQVFGDGHGLAIDSTPRAGTVVRLRVPKYRPGVRAS